MKRSRIEGYGLHSKRLQLKGGAPFSLLAPLLISVPVTIFFGGPGFLIMFYIIFSMLRMHKKGFTIRGAVKSLIRSNIGDYRARGDDLKNIDF